MVIVWLIVGNPERIWRKKEVKKHHLDKRKKESQGMAPPKIKSLKYTCKDAQLYEENNTLHRNINNILKDFFHSYISSAYYFVIFWFVSFCFVVILSVCFCCILHYFIITFSTFILFWGWARLWIWMKGKVERILEELQDGKL